MTANNPFDFTDVSGLPLHVQEALARRPKSRARKIAAAVGATGARGISSADTVTAEGGTAKAA